MALVDMRDISYEFFPPKTEQGIANLVKTANILAKTTPGYFSVTYGAGGSTREGTLNTVALLQEATSVSIAPHISCIGATKEDIQSLLAHYQEVGVHQLVALRGDLPSGMGNSAGDFLYAADLVKFIRDTTGDFFRIQVAAYLEVHPAACNAREDVLHFQKKVMLGADGAITQFFYNPDAYFYFLEKCEELDITIPIVPGVMPVTQFAKQVKFADQCGAEIPRWIRKRFEAYQDDTKSMDAFAEEMIARFCERLLAGGAPGLHIYTLNQPESSVKLIEYLKK